MSAYTASDVTFAYTDEFKATIAYRKHKKIYLKLLRKDYGFSLHAEREKIQVKRLRKILNERHIELLTYTKIHREDSYYWFTQHDEKYVVPYRCVHNRLYPLSCLRVTGPGYPEFTRAGRPLGNTEFVGRYIGKKKPLRNPLPFPMPRDLLYKLPDMKGFKPVLIQDMSSVNPDYVCALGTCSKDIVEKLMRVTF